MSIQPNRVVARIIHQVDQSDWPRLESRVVADHDGTRWLRLYQAPMHPRYASPIHFWVHALRDELAATGRRDDLVGAAGHALCRKVPVEQWLEPMRFVTPSGPRGAGVAEALIRTVGGLERAEAYRMLESECRQSSVLDGGRLLVADFWGHGAGPSWRVSG